MYPEEEDSDDEEDDEEDEGDDESLLGLSTLTDDEGRHSDDEEDDEEKEKDADDESLIFLPILTDDEEDDEDSDDNEDDKSYVPPRFTKSELRVAARKKRAENELLGRAITEARRKAKEAVEDEVDILSTMMHDFWI
jgi:hypothetical protein